jgi:hypothetical protein
MTNLNTYIYPNWVNIIDDDHFDAEWSIPVGVTPGNFTVRYEHYPTPWWPWWPPTIYDVPGGFNITACQATAATITAQSATTFCQGGSVVLTASTIPGATYYWYRDNTYAGSGINFTAIYSGTYHVSAFSAAGCHLPSSPVIVTVNPLPTATITWTSPPQFCPGDSATLIANTLAGASYQWYLGSLPVAGATSQTLKTSTAGGYRVLVTNTSGCARFSSPVTVTALSLPAASITTSGPTTFCAGTGVTLSANTGTGLTYQWFKYGNAISGAVQPTLFVTNSAKYKVQVTNSGGCTKKSSTVTTTSIPLPPAVITAQGATTFCAGDSVVLSANTGAGLTYQWKKYSNTISGATLSNYTAKTAGKYKAVVTNTYGCSRTSNAITVSTPCRIQNAQTAEGEVIFTVDRAQQKLFVSGSESRPVEVISIDGKVVIRVNNYDMSGIDLSQLHAGMYVAVTRTEMETFSHKFYYSRED